jgi:hypothetical protein
MSSNVMTTPARLNNGMRNSSAPSSSAPIAFSQSEATEREKENNRSTSRSAPRVRIKTVALPVEHGGWGLSLEPVVLGMLLAPSLAGLCLAFATVGAFLARHPLKIAVADWRRARRFPRTRMAEAFAALYSAIALLSFVAALWLGPAELLIPLAAALPLAVIQLAYDFTSRSRALLPELSGATAMAAVVASLVLAGGWRLATGLALWAILVARVLPTILYVRARLRAARGEKVSSGIIIFTHLLACAVALILVLQNLTTVLALIALSILLGRALMGLNSRPVSAKRVGITELIYGAMLVAFIVAGHALGI